MSGKTEYKAIRRFNVVNSSFDAESMTVDCVYATDAIVDRGEYQEQLVISADAIDTRRLDNGAVPLIWNHAWDEPKIVGRVIEHWLEGGKAVCRIRLSQTPYSKGTIDDIRDGILTSVSVGYTVLDYDEEQGKDTRAKVIRRVNRWMPFEVSIVGIPADENAAFRSMKRMDEELENGGTPADDNADTVALATALEDAQTKIGEAMDALLNVLDAQEEKTGLDEVREKAFRVSNIASRALSASTSEEEIADAVSYALDELAKIQESLDFDEDGEDEPEAPSADVAEERSRVSAIALMCRSFRVSDADTQKMIRSGVSVKGARQMIKENKVKRSSGPLAGPRARVITDLAAVRREQVADAIYSRMSGKAPSEKGRALRGMSMTEMARSLIGASASSMNATQLYGTLMGRSFGAHTSSDLGFVDGFADAVNLRLRERREAAPQEWTPILERTTVRDFRPVTTASAGSFPAFRLIPEGAEIEFGTGTGDTGVLQLAKYGRAIAFTFEAFINDDIRLIDSMISDTARKARMLEDALIYGAFTSDAVRSDGLPTFSADPRRGNVIAEALDMQGLAVAQAALRLQKDVDEQPMNYKGDTLIVGPDNEMAARRLATPTAAITTDQVNIFAGVIRNIIVEPRITGDDWYLVASGQGDAIEFATLDGHEGVQVEQVWDPKISATAFYAKSYAGAALTGGQGFVKSLGADETEDGA